MPLCPTKGDSGQSRPKNQNYKSARFNYKTGPFNYKTNPLNYRNADNSNI